MYKDLLRSEQTDMDYEKKKATGRVLSGHLASGSQLVCCCFCKFHIYQSVNKQPSSLARWANKIQNCRQTSVQPS